MGLDFSFGIDVVVYNMLVDVNCGELVFGVLVDEMLLNDFGFCLFL